MQAIIEIIGYPLGFIMWLFYKLCNNYALSLVLFTLVVRAALFPLAVKSQKSQAAMTAFSPKLEELKQKYSNNKEKLNEEMMKLYAEEGINPMSGCLPMAIQMPILFGLFDVVYRPFTHLFHLSNDVITGAINFIKETYPNIYADRYFMSRPQIYMAELGPAAFADVPSLEPLHTALESLSMNLFGFIDLTQTPTLTPAVWDASAVGLVAIPIISFLIQIASSVFMMIKQKKMQQASGMADNPMMKSMMMSMFIMPVFSLFISFSFPAGVGFYWAVGGLLALLQMVILHKIYTPEYVAKLVEEDRKKNKHKAKKRSSMMERYQKMLEEQQARTDGAAEAVRRNTITMSAAGAEGVSGDPGKLTKSKQKDIERALINEARRKYAEKYGDEYKDE